MSLADAAISRRFFIGPLLALALAGAAPAAPFFAPEPGATSGSTASPTPTPTTPDEAAKRAILIAHDAEAVYFVDNLVYAAAVGEELASLRAIEPALDWGTQVTVQSPTEEAAGAEVVILRAQIDRSGALCISEVSEVKDAGTWYARVTGRKRCPARADGMPGWTEDQAAGWEL
jgi:hypothetical protein